MGFDEEGGDFGREGVAFVVAVQVGVDDWGVGRAGGGGAGFEEVAGRVDWYFGEGEGGGEEEEEEVGGRGEHGGGGAMGWGVVGGLEMRSVTRS